MARRGSTKWLSVRQEDHVATVYHGTRSASSGAAATDPGDVRNRTTLFECKHRGTFDKPARSISIKLDDLEKILDEAYSLNKEPVLALCIYAPDSVLSDADGNVHLVTRLMKNDVLRELEVGAI